MFNKRFSLVFLGFVALTALLRSQSTVSPVPYGVTFMATREMSQSSSTEVKDITKHLDVLAYYSSAIPAASVRFTLSSGTGITLYPDAAGKVFSACGLTAQGMAFNNEFAGGTVTVTTTNSPSLAASLLLLIPAYEAPAASRFTNFEELQNSTAEKVTFRWAPLPSNAEEDIVIFGVYDEKGTSYFQTSTGQLTNRSTEITVGQLPKSGKFVAKLMYAPYNFLIGQTSTAVIYSYGFSIQCPLVRAEPSIKTSLVCHPNSQVIVRGQPLTLDVVAEGVGLTYQWMLDNKAISGATLPTYFVAAADRANAGSYHVVVKDPLGNTLRSRDAVVTIADTANPVRLINLSIRTLAGSGENSLILGIITGGGTSGANTTPVLMRVAGPALASFGVTGTLPDPQFSVYSGSNIIASNNDWHEAQFVEANRKAFTQCYAFSFADNSRDAALVTKLNPGSYSMVVSDYLGGTGTGLAEIYDASEGTGAARLQNVSIRANFSPNSPLIAGFVLDRGTTARSVLIRAIGPTLQKYGVGNPLMDSQLTLYRGDYPIYQNDNWGVGDKAAQIAAASAKVGAFSLDGSSKDAVLLVNLPPGAYTAMISSPTGGSGIAMIEIFEVP